MQHLVCDFNHFLFFHSQERSLPHLRPVWASALIHFENHRKFHKSMGEFQDPKMEVLYITVPYKANILWFLSHGHWSNEPPRVNGHCFIGPSHMSRCMSILATKIRSLSYLSFWSRHFCIPFFHLGYLGALQHVLQLAYLGSQVLLHPPCRISCFAGERMPSPVVFSGLGIICVLCWLYPRDESHCLAEKDANMK